VDDGLMRRVTTLVGVEALVLTLISFSTPYFIYPEELPTWHAWAFIVSLGFFFAALVTGAAALAVRSPARAHRIVLASVIALVLALGLTAAIGASTAYNATKHSAEDFSE